MLLKITVYFTKLAKKSSLILCLPVGLAGCEPVWQKKNGGYKWRILRNKTWQKCLQSVKNWFPFMDIQNSVKRWFLNRSFFAEKIKFTATDRKYNGEVDDICVLTIIQLYTNRILCTIIVLAKAASAKCGELSERRPSSTLPWKRWARHASSQNAALSPWLTSDRSSRNFRTHSWSTCTTHSRIARTSILSWTTYQAVIYATISVDIVASVKKQLVSLQISSWPFFCF